MRITKNLQDQIFANLLASHPLQQRAMDATKHRQHILLKLMAEVAKKEIGGEGSQADIREYLRKLGTSCNNSSFFDLRIFESAATINLNGDGEPVSFWDNGTTIYLGGMVRYFKIDGDVNDAQIAVSDITPPSFEFGLAVELLELRDETKSGYSKYYPIYLMRSAPKLAADHWFSVAVDANDAERRAILAEFTALKSSVYAALSKCSTVKKLAEAWPEIMDFVPKEQKPTGTGLALNREDLNAICGLPK
jgi:hypothetical protein